MGRYAPIRPVHLLRNVSARPIRALVRRAARPAAGIGPRAGRPRRPPSRSTSTCSPTPAQHRTYIEAHYPDIPYRRALFIKEHGLAGLYAYRHADLAVDLRHECTHAMLHASLPYVPLWLDEGLAEYFEATARRPGVRPSAFRRPGLEHAAGDGSLGVVAGATARSVGHGGVRVPLLLGLGSISCCTGRRRPTRPWSATWQTSGAATCPAARWPTAWNTRCRRPPKRWFNTSNTGGVESSIHMPSVPFCCEDASLLDNEDLWRKSRERLARDGCASNRGRMLDFAGFLAGISRSILSRLGRRADTPPVQCLVRCRWLGIDRMSGSTAYTRHVPPMPG